MERFIRNRNIEHFRELLRKNPGCAERELLERLLAEEEAKAEGELGKVSPRPDDDHQGER